MYCKFCGKEIDMEEAHPVSPEGYACDDCYHNDKYDVCPKCGALFDPDEIYASYEDENGEYICESCFQDKVVEAYETLKDLRLRR